MGRSALITFTYGICGGKLNTSINDHVIFSTESCGEAFSNPRIVVPREYCNGELLQFKMSVDENVFISSIDNIAISKLKSLDY